jgi:NhaP-type Na+/H+ or K+/H+ antiporter
VDEATASSLMAWTLPWRKREALALAGLAVVLVALLLARVAAVLVERLRQTLATHHRLARARRGPNGS